MIDPKIRIATFTLVGLAILAAVFGIMKSPGGNGGSRGEFSLPPDPYESAEGRREGRIRADGSFAAGETGADRAGSSESAAGQTPGAEDSAGEGGSEAGQPAPGESPGGSSGTGRPGLPGPGEGTPGEATELAGLPGEEGMSPGAELPEDATGLGESETDYNPDGTPRGGPTPVPTPSPTPGPRQGVIAGKVLRGERGVIGAILFLVPESGNRLTAYSDETGQYYFPPVDAGTYSLSLHYPLAPRPFRKLLLEDGAQLTDQDFVIPDLPPVTGQVVDDRTGDGIPKPQLEVTQGTRVFGTILGDGSGEFTLFPLDPGNYTVKVVARGYRPGEESFELTEDSSRVPELLIRLDSALRVSGRVVAPNGSPASQAIVALFGSASVFNDPYSVQPWQVTGADGLFAFESLPAGAGPFRVGALHEGSVPVYSEFIDPEQGARELGDLQLARGAVVTGTVVDKQEKPVPFVEVQVTTGFPQTHGIFQRFNVELPGTETDASGGFAIQAVEPGQTTVRFSAADYTTKEVTTQVGGPATDMGKIVLESSTDPKEGRLAGIVVDERGTGIRGRVYVICRECDPQADALQETNALGQFSFDELPEGSYEVYAAGGTLRGDLFINLNQEYVGARPGSENLVLYYDLSHSLTAKIVDVSGNPIRRVSVFARVVDEPPVGEEGLRKALMEYDTQVEAADGNILLEHLMPGVLNLTFTAPDVGTEQISGAMIPWDEPRINLGEIRIGEGAELAGSVVAEENPSQGLQGVRVMLVPPQGSGPDHPVPYGKFNTTTDAAGSFSLTGLPTAMVDVQMEREGRVRTFVRGVPIEAGSVKNLGDVAMEQAAHVRGTVRDAVSAAPLQDVHIILGGVEVALTDGQGQYSSRSVPPGPVTVDATHVVEGYKHQRYVDEFTAPPGEVTVFDFEMEPEG